MIVFRPTDRIPIEVDGITIWVRPITNDDYAKVMQHISMKGGLEERNSLAISTSICQLCITKVDGLNDLKHLDGTEVKIEFDEMGSITNESLEILTQVVGLQKLMSVGNAISNKFQTSSEGVVVKLDKAVSEKK